MPPEDPVDVGSPDTVGVDFPHAGWSFAASFGEVGTECSRRRSATIRPDSAGDGSRVIIEPVGPAGTYDVEVYGTGPQGSLSASVRWTTPVDAPAAQPSAEVRVLDEKDTGAVVLGMELYVSDLATTTRVRETSHRMATPSPTSSSWTSTT